MEPCVEHLLYELGHTCHLLNHRFKCHYVRAAIYHKQRSEILNILGIFTRPAQHRRPLGLSSFKFVGPPNSAACRVLSNSPVRWLFTSADFPTPLSPTSNTSQDPQQHSPHCGPLRASKQDKFKNQTRTRRKKQDTSNTVFAFRMAYSHVNIHIWS